jgi:hypothetical protein
MDIQTTIIGVAMLLLIILPIILFSKSGKKKKMELFKKMNALSSTGKVKMQNACNNIAFGIDDSTKQAFYCKHTNSGIIGEVVDLSKIQSVVANKTVVTIDKTNHIDVIDSLEMIFKPIDKSMKDIKWTIYEHEKEGVVYGEPQLVEEWTHIINNHLK